MRFICGDFNDILDGEEHSHFEEYQNISLGMRDFQEVVRYCSLLDLIYQGPRYTWSNKREEGIICKKLDRGLVNDCWLQKYPQSYCRFDSGGCSDHARGRINMGEPVTRVNRPFKFTNVLANLPQFQDTVEKFWADTEPVYLSTSAQYRFSKKLKALKPVLRVMGKENLADISKRTHEAHDDLCNKQAATLADPSTLNVVAEAEAYTRWNRLSGLEEGYLKQKSKLHWLNVGDQNNTYFHKSVEIRKMQNSIREITNHQGEVFKTNEAIKGEAVRFFTDFLTQIPADYQGTSVEYIQQLLAFRCSDLDKTMLIKEVSDEEIKKVLFSMPNNKSPGPDGYKSEFFKKAWSIFGKDFTIAIKSLFVKGFLPQGLNATILALIPKKTGATEMKDYRPISCCNVMYKVISKIIANRLKVLLPKFIAQNQSAFVKDRLLMENVLLATEIVKDYHKETTTPQCATKN